MCKEDETTTSTHKIVVDVNAPKETYKQLVEGYTIFDMSIFQNINTALYFPECYGKGLFVEEDVSGSAIVVTAKVNTLLQL